MVGSLVFSWPSQIALYRMICVLPYALSKGGRRLLLPNWGCHGTHTYTSPGMLTHGPVNAAVFRSDYRAHVIYSAGNLLSAANKPDPRPGC